MIHHKKVLELKRIYRFREILIFGTQNHQKFSSLEAGGELSTKLPPGRLVELRYMKTKTQRRRTVEEEEEYSEAIIAANR